MKSSVATVPYKGTSQIIPDLLAGNIDLSRDQAPVYVNMHKAGQVKVIAVIADERSPLFPEVPTLKEVGINFTSAPWYGVQAPKGTPKDIVDKMNAGIKEVLYDPANKDKIAAAGYTPKVGSPADSRQARQGRREAGADHQEVQHQGRVTLARPNESPAEGGAFFMRRVTSPAAE